MNSITLLKLAEMEAEGAMMKELAGEAQDAGIDPTAVDQNALIEALLAQGDESQAEEQDDLSALLAAAEQEAGPAMNPAMGGAEIGGGAEQSSPDIMALLSALSGAEGGMPAEAPEEIPEEAPEEPETEYEESGEDDVEEIKEAAMQKAAAFLRSF